MNLIQLLRKSEKLIKSGQFIKFPKSIFKWVDEGKRVPKSSRDSYQRAFDKGGKIHPDELDELLTNYNPDIINLILENTNDQEIIGKIAQKAKNFKRQAKYESREFVKDVKNEITNRFYRLGPGFMNEAVKKASPYGVQLMAKAFTTSLESVARDDEESSTLLNSFVNNAMSEESNWKNGLFALHALKDGMYIKDVSAENAKKAMNLFIEKAPKEENGLFTNNNHESALYGVAGALSEKPEILLGGIKGSNYYLDRLVKKGILKPNDDNLDFHLRSGNPLFEEISLPYIKNKDQMQFAIENLLNDPDTVVNRAKSLLADRSDRQEVSDTEEEGKIFNADSINGILSKIKDHGKVNEFFNDYGMSSWRSTNLKKSFIGEGNLVDGPVKVEDGLMNEIIEQLDFLSDKDRASYSTKLFENIISHFVGNENSDVNVFKKITDKAFSYDHARSKYGSKNSVISSVIIDHKDISKEKINEFLNYSRTVGNEDFNNVANVIANEESTDLETLKRVYDMAKEYVSENYSARSDSLNNLLSKLITHPEISRDLFIDIQENFSETAAFNGNAASSPAFGPDDLDNFLEKTNDLSAVKKALNNPNIKESHLSIVANKEDPDMRNLVWSHEKITPELFERLALDKDKAVRSNALRYIDSLPSHVMNQMVVGDRSEDIQLKLMKSPKVSNEAILQSMVKNPTPEKLNVFRSITDGVDGRRYKTEEVEKIYNTLTKKLKQRSSKLDKAEQAWIEDGSPSRSYFRRNTPKSLKSYEFHRNKYKQESNSVFAILSTAPEIANKAIFEPYMKDETVNKIFRDSGSFITEDSIKKYYEKNKENISKFNELDANSTERENAIKKLSYVLSNPNTNNMPEISNDIKNSEILTKKEKDSIFVENLNNVSDEIRKDVISNPGFFSSFINRVDTDTVNDSVISDIIETAPENENQSLIIFLKYSIHKDKDLKPETLDKAYSFAKTFNSGFDSITLIKNIVDHHGVSEKILKDASKSDTDSISRTANKKLAFINPDSYNNSLEYNDTFDDHYKKTREIEVHPAIEKLKHFKGVVSDLGRGIHKRELEKHGLKGIPTQILDHKGEITTDGIDKFIEALPKQKFNVSWEHWGLKDDLLGKIYEPMNQYSMTGAQRHDSSRSQRVFQLNLTNDLVNKMKEEGVFSDFLKISDRVPYNSHPMQPISLGWARFDEHNTPTGKHAHIDEVQSDHWSGMAAAVYSIKQSTKIPSHEKEEKIGKIKKLDKILRGGFKNLNHAIVAAAHNTLRQIGYDSTSMDTPEDQVSQSGMRSSTAKHNFTYKQWPTDNKFDITNKKEVMPEDNSMYNQVQYRKLVKSLSRVKYLLSKIDEE